MYAAHKAAGGITSIYRQVGVGSERLVRRIIKQSLELTDKDIDWNYSYAKPDGKSGTHILDAKIQSDSLRGIAGERFDSWVQQSSRFVASSSQASRVIGAVFEIRQGYKSADSKRQNADLRFGMRAYQSSLLPVFAILSSQVSDPVIRRYRSDGMLVLTGLLNNDPKISTFAFFQHVIGYDLAAFFARNSERIKSELRVIIRYLLDPE